MIDNRTSANAAEKGVADLYLDRNVCRGTALYLRGSGRRAVTALELSFERLSGDVDLLIASESGWILVTHDPNDFTKLHAVWGAGSAHRMQR